jgi:hypothetical protein
MSVMHEGVIFRGEQLLPEAWRTFTTEGPVRTFNPGLLREQNGWLFAYRLVGADGLRRIGICRLNRELQVIEGSQVAWSDHVRFRADGVYPEVGTRWFADPRLYRFGGRTFIYWNSGWHEPRNCQFVQELDVTTLLPLGHARELVLNGERQKLEKNWTFFASEDGSCHAVYSISPHRVLEFSFDGSDDIHFNEVSRTEWSLFTDYPANHGGLRGGAPAVFADGAFWSFCHSVHNGPDGYRYLPAVYSFSGQSPFAPTAGPTRPLDLHNPLGGKRTYERLNSAVGEVIYPCGAARDGARWLISHGINDEYSAISVVEHADVLATLQPITPPG